MTEFHDLPAETRRMLEKQFPGVAGVRLGFSAAMLKQQRAWPDPCPVSEEELRGEIQALVDGFKALQDRGRKLFDKLPNPPDAEFKGEMPTSVYYTLTDALSIFIDDMPDILCGVERGLGETPEGLLGEWLSSQLKCCGRGSKEPGAGRALLRLIRALDVEEGGHEAAAE